ncbi:MAG: hypothetical protein AAF409_07215 [Pseudomonadota bacterium]
MGENDGEIVRRLTAFSVVACFLGLAACDTRPVTVGGDLIGPQYAVGGGEWSSGGGITAVAHVVDRAGRAAVCGAWMTDRQSALSSQYNEDVMQAAAVFADGTRLVSNLSFMRRLQWRQDLTGQSANCVETGFPYSADLAAQPLALRFPRLSFGDRRGVGTAGIGLFSGDGVSFREGPRPRPFPGG